MGFAIIGLKDPLEPSPPPLAAAAAAAFCCICCIMNGLNMPCCIAAAAAAGSIPSIPIIIPPPGMVARNSACCIANSSRSKRSALRSSNTRRRHSPISDLYLDRNAASSSVYERFVSSSASFHVLDNILLKSALVALGNSRLSAARRLLENAKNADMGRFGAAGSLGVRLLA